MKNLILFGAFLAHFWRTFFEKGEGVTNLYDPRNTPLHMHFQSDTY